MALKGFDEELELTESRYLLLVERLKTCALKKTVTIISRTIKIDGVCQARNAKIPIEGELIE